MFYLYKVEYCLHYGTFCTILVVGCVEKGAECSVKDAINSSIDKSINAGIGETVDSLDESHAECYESCMLT